MNSIREALGSGQFSIVNKAEWFNDNTSTEVAVKQLKLTDSESKVKLLQEAATMGQFSHSNVLKLHGIVTDSVTVRIIVYIQYLPGIHLAITCSGMHE